jgi:hypothetical protein
MDASRLGQGYMIAGIGGVVLLVSLFLDWISGVTITIGAATLSTSGNAWDVFSGVDILMALVGLAAILIAGVTTTGVSIKTPASAPWVLALLGIGTIGWTLGWDLENPNAGIGAWIGLFAAIAIAYGGFEASRSPQRTARPQPSPSPVSTERSGPATPPTS